MSVDTRFLFDFGSPNAYLAHKVLPRIAQRTGVRFTYVPVLLGGIFKLTNNRSPAEAFAQVKNKREFMALEVERFVARHGISSFRRNPHFPVNTLMLMRAATAVRGTADFDRFVEAAFHHMWEDPKKMDDPATARAALLASGIDADQIFARAQADDVKKALMATTQDAVDRGAFGAPTFFVGDAMYYGKDQLRDVEDAIMARKGERPAT